MGIDKDSKLNHLMKIWKKNTVITAGTLKRMGYSYQLLDKYKKHDWLRQFGKGAYIVSGHKINWPGALYTLQNDLNLPIRVGGITALELSGFAHYLKNNNQIVQLFGIEAKTLPLWFINIMAKENICIIAGSFLKKVETVPVIKKEYGDFSITISAPEAAYLEMLSTVPAKTSFPEALEIAENLTTLRSKILQQLLSVSTSVKVNRLALFMGQYHRHDWFYKLDEEKINIGSGKRVIHKKGHLDRKYKITVPDRDEE